MLAPQRPLKSDYQGKNFIHLDNKSLNDNYPFLSISVKNAIRRINRLISNPENDFNKSNLGIHTLGLVPISEIKPLNALGFGLAHTKNGMLIKKTQSWNGIEVFDRESTRKCCKTCNKNPKCKCGTSC